VYNTQAKTFDKRQNPTIHLFNLCGFAVYFLHTAYCANEPKQIKLECGPMPNLMVALPSIGGALCSTPQSLADAHY